MIQTIEAAHGQYNVAGMDRRAADDGLRQPFAGCRGCGGIKRCHQNRLPADAALEAREHQIVAGMTLAQKVGPMTPAEIKTITRAEVRSYYIGSVLNGGGSWPGGNKHAGIKDWQVCSEAYFDASMSTDLAIKVPVSCGIDAVHGDNDVSGATLFPHNIGLGAAHDPDLIETSESIVFHMLASAPFSAAFAHVRISRPADGRAELPCARVDAP